MTIKEIIIETIRENVNKEKAEEYAEKFWQDILEQEVQLDEVEQHLQYFCTSFVEEDNDRSPAYKALLYAEKWGIIDYKVEDNVMIWEEHYPTEGGYEHRINLDDYSHSSRNLYDNIEQRKFDGE